MSDAHVRATILLANLLSAAAAPLPDVWMEPGEPGEPVEAEVERGPLEGDDERLHAGTGAIPTFEELGALSPAEASAWRRRFAIARGVRPAPPADAATRAAARGHLEGLVRAMTAGPDEDEVDTALTRLSAALGLLLDLGCVLVDELDDWRARIDEAHGAPAEPDPPPPPSRPATPVPLPDPRGELRRVVVIPPARHDGMCPTSVELWEDKTVIAWHLLREGRISRAESAAFGTDFVLADDVGTVYERDVSGGGGWTGPCEGPFAVLGDSRCATPVPPEASELTISRGAAVWRVPLRARPM